MTEETINTLCEKFHTTIDNLIPVYSEYAMIKDLISFLICLVIVAICIITILIMYKRGNEKHYYDDILYTPFRYITVLAIAAVVAIICIIAMCCNMYDYVLWHNYPQLRFFDVIVNM